MGYGKTTAVSSFLSARDNPVMWISFISSEDTPSFFWNRLAEQIGRMDEAIGTKLKNLGFPSNAPQVANILSLLTHLLFKKRTVLVIDDFHLAGDRQIGEFLESVVKEELEHFHIVLITRDTTNIDFAEFAAKRLCYILSQQELKFSYEEVKRYCWLAGFHLSEKELVEISDYTGGCISLIKGVKKFNFSPDHSGPKAVYGQNFYALASLVHSGKLFTPRPVLGFNLLITFVKTVHLIAGHLTPFRTSIFRLAHDLCGRHQYPIRSFPPPTAHIGLSCKGQSLLFSRYLSLPSGFNQFDQ